ncbi:MAG: rubrerythrin-like domain-containing protein [Halanaeroarchaeum sp.]
MRDVTNSPSTTGPYECFNCGQIVTDPDAGRCPECHGQLRNRQMPIE